MSALHETAPAKINLCLFLGPARRQDGRHELVTVFQPLSLADRVTLAPAPLGSASDEVLCPDVDGDNLALAALRAFRERTGWTGGPVRVEIDKRIPVAAGLAGGSADAAAALRLAARAAGVRDDRLLREVARALGADVPAQVRPHPVLATGAGDELRRSAPQPEPYAVVLLRARRGLATAEVFREADRQGLGRSAADLDARRAEVERGLGARPFGLAAELLHNDLEPAARALHEEVEEAIDAMRGAGAAATLLCGSGPTVAGFFADTVRARAAATSAAGLADRDPAPVLTAPWRAAR